MEIKRKTKSNLILMILVAIIFLSFNCLSQKKDKKI
jgi:hypothetical protein